MLLVENAKTNKLKLQVKQKLILNLKSNIFNAWYVLTGKAIKVARMITILD